MSYNITIRFKMNNGKTRICTSVCHNSFGQRCRCVCGGLNHGVGIEAAFDNIPALLEQKESMGFSSVTYRHIQLAFDFFG